MKEKTETMALTEEQLGIYADTYLSLYRMNRQEANDYIANLRKLLKKEVVLSILQRAMEKSITAYRMAAPAI